jgi:hypothetical protein
VKYYFNQTAKIHQIFFKVKKLNAASPSQD